ncbi:MAG: PDZ domain-containing protein, partial [Rhodobacteraceae bacterium]|nr:PDZ domain-containing protein [Paracoccaceae bacterium]
ADLVVLRGGDETDVSITVGKMDADEVASAAMPGDSGAGVAVADLGLSLQTLTPTDSQALGLPEDTQGAIVSRVEPGGEAADKGIQQGDVILSVNQASVASAEDVATAIEKARNKHRDAALLLIARGQERSFVAVPFHVG